MYVKLILLSIIVCILVYILYVEYQQYISKEGCYPRRWWHGPHRRWGWRRPWLVDYGNWRPYAYYPAYSGYWNQCPNGSWCPPYKSCMDPECS